MKLSARTVRCRANDHSSVPHHSAHPKCRLGIAANGLAIAFAALEWYDHRPPIVSSVSTKQSWHGYMRGGASGNAK